MQNNKAERLLADCDGTASSNTADSSTKRIVIIATNNKGKLKEFREIMTDCSVLSLADCGINVDVEETADTFFGNALLKAKAVFDIANGDDELRGKLQCGSQLIQVISDDSGLVVDALGGAPGVYSARFSGENASDNSNIDLLLHRMEEVADRRAKFVSCVVLYLGNSSVSLGESEYIAGFGECCGEIMTARHGEKGFGYDSVFFSHELNKSFGEATDVEKNSVSHRHNAIADLMTKLK